MQRQKIIASQAILLKIKILNAFNASILGQAANPVLHPSYAGKDFVIDPTVLQVHADGGPADPEDWTQLDLKSRVSLCGEIKLDEQKCSLNPFITDHAPHGRGLLYRWGPNQAADSIVTWFEKGQLMTLLIFRKFDQQWGNVGGFHDASETIMDTSLRELQEESFRSTSLEKLIKAIKPYGHIIYQGYVPDRRNTRNAWIETTTFHYHLPFNLTDQFQLSPDDDAAKAEKMPLKKALYHSLYAGSSWMIRLAGAHLLDQDINLSSAESQIIQAPLNRTRTIECRN